MNKITTVACSIVCAAALGFSTAGVADASPYLYSRACHPLDILRRQSQFLTAKTWVHQGRGNTHWTRPVATKHYKMNRRWLPDITYDFDHFEFDHGFKRKYQHSLYRWHVGGRHSVKAVWSVDHGDAYINCYLEPLR